MFDMLIDDLGATIFRVVPYLVYSHWEGVNDDPNVMNWEYYFRADFEATWKGLAIPKLHARSFCMPFVADHFADPGLVSFDCSAV